MIDVFVSDESGLELKYFMALANNGKFDRDDEAPLFVSGLMVAVSDSIYANALSVYVMPKLDIDVDGYLTNRDLDQ